MGFENKKFTYAGAIHADGHILESPDTRERYIDPQFRDRAIRVYPNADGLEIIEVGGRPAKYMRPGRLASSCAMGQRWEDLEPHPNQTYVGQAPFGSMDPKERVARLNQEGLEKADIYPSMGLLWEAEDIEDLELRAAYVRAYNRWVEDFCADSKGRIIPIAHISMGDPQEAARELERSVKNGTEGAFFVPFTPTNRSHAHPDFDPFWAKVQEFDVPVGIHPNGEPQDKRVHQRFRDMQKWVSSHLNVYGVQEPLQAFTAMFEYGQFDRFPTVKIVDLESGAGWAGYLLDRMAIVFDSPLGETVLLKE